MEYKWLIDGRLEGGRMAVSFSSTAPPPFQWGSSLIVTGLGHLATLRRKQTALDHLDWAIKHKQNGGKQLSRERFSHF
jgi:hypothetical protein